MPISAATWAIGRVRHRSIKRRLPFTVSGALGCHRLVLLGRERLCRNSHSFGEDQPVDFSPASATCADRDLWYAQRQALCEHRRQSAVRSSATKYRSRKRRRGHRARARRRQVSGSTVPTQISRDHSNSATVFSEGTDLSRFDRRHVDTVADALNNRPRKELKWRTPAEVLAEQVHSSSPDGVATTS